MSASLVGSEMCIRDRNNQYSLPRSPRTCEDVAEDVRACEASEEYSGINVLKIVMKNLVMKHSCLLYTSDAADDM
eukprot:6181514-Alexandrium_andersonii.AAC.1